MTKPAHFGLGSIHREFKRLHPSYPDDNSSFLDFMVVMATKTEEEPCAIVFEESQLETYAPIRCCPAGNGCNAYQGEGQCVHRLPHSEIENCQRVNSPCPACVEQTIVLVGREERLET